MAKYKIIPSSRTIVQSPISIGHKAEKGVEAIEFDLTAWVETYGSGTLTVIMRRWGDAIPYPIALEIDENNKATWTLSDIDTAKAGMAYAQLNYIVGDEVVKKSDIYTFRVMDSLTGEGDPPEAYESWLEHLTHFAAEAMAEVLDIEGIVTDKTLTVNGGIADAKATGDALALKADKSTSYTKTEVDALIDEVEVETDTTLEIAGAPADAAETGRQIGLIKADLENIDGIIYSGSGGEGESLTGNIVQFNSADVTPTGVSVDGGGTTSGTLTVCGVNIHPKHEGGSASGLTWTVDSDGVMSFTGTPTADVLIRLRNKYIPVDDTNKTNFTACCFNNMSDSRLALFFVNSNNTQNWQINMSSVNAVANTSNMVAVNIVEFRLRIPKDVNWTGLTLKPMLIVGSVAPSEFVPYSGQDYAVTLGSDGKVQESISYKSGINTLFSNFGAVTVYQAAEQTNIRQDLTALTQVVDRGNSLYRYEASGNARYLHVYYKSGDSWVKWQLHNVPASDSNSDTWQIGRVCGLDGNLENLVELVRGGEFELAIREHGADDYCGGNNHGDETTDTFKLFIDGKPVSDLSTLPTDYTPFSRIDAFEIATVNRCNTPAEDIVKHQKVWTFSGGKVKIRQTLKFLETLSIDVAMVCMCAALRSAFPYGVRKGGVAIEDMTTDSYTKVYTAATDIFYEYYGDKATCKVHAKTDNSNNTSVMWINNTSDLNKLYYGYYGITNSANPTTVTANTVITAESEYDVAYTA